MTNIAPNITVIPAKKIVGTQSKDIKNAKTRVAAYARVSTDNIEQEMSYEAQVNHYTTYIKSNPEWEFAGIYADDGITGMNTAKREEFHKMINDCELGFIDMIITKSISRFARNTLDCLKYTRQLKKLNIPVYFEKENINTLDVKGEVLLTIMASLAQQESESISANVRMGMQYRNQEGKIMVNHNRFLGYTKDENKNLVIEPEEAKVVKRIYREYLDGRSLIEIKHSLEADGIENGAHNLTWNVSNIKQILSNEKYIGDALLQKTYTVDVMEKIRKRNNGALPKYYVEGSHEAIIDKEVFLRVQSEMRRRAAMIKNGRKSSYSGKYALSGIVICDNCGKAYSRATWNIWGRKEIVWRCTGRLNKEERCDARIIKETELQKYILEAINLVFGDKTSVIETLSENIKIALSGDTADKLLEIDKELSAKQKELVGLTDDGDIADSIGDEILSLRSKRQEYMDKLSECDEIKERMKEMTEFLNNQSTKLEEYDDGLVRRLIEQIIVKDKERIVVRFKSGIEIEV